MQKECDICGNVINDTDNFCGMCNVDLREAKSPDEPEIIMEKPRPSQNEGESTSKMDPPKDKDVIHWCTIHALCNSYEMSFPLFLNLVLILATGKKKLGFCGCPACNQGYRQMLADIVNATEKKKLTAQSRAIVIKARGAKIDGVKFDIPEYVEVLTKKEGKISAPQIEHPEPHPPISEKITIEINSGALENAVFKILKSEKGQEIIRSIPRKSTRTKGPDGKRKKGEITPIA